MNFTAALFALSIFNLLTTIRAGESGIIALAVKSVGEAGMEPVLGLGGVILIMTNSIFKVVHVHPAQIKDQEKNMCPSQFKGAL